VDFNETFSTVVFKESIKLMITQAAIDDMEIVTFDVSLAFIYSKIEEGRNIYVKIPHGYSDPLNRDTENAVFRLNRYLYGLRESPLEWSKTFSDYWTKKGFTRSEMDTNIFTKKGANGKWSRIGVHVDDRLVTTDKETAKIIIDELKAEFQITSSMDPEVYLGINFYRDRKRHVIGLNQSRYIQKLRDSIPRPNPRKFTTPLPADFAEVFENEEEVDPKLVKEFQRGIGLCIYLTLTRPDIQVGVNSLARRVSNPTRKDIDLSYRILYYVMDTEDFKLWYGKLDEEPLVIYSDASHGTGPNRKSRTGLIGLYYG
jgi:hypothetical protein